MSAYAICAHEQHSHRYRIMDRQVAHSLRALLPWREIRIKQATHGRTHTKMTGEKRPPI